MLLPRLASMSVSDLICQSGLEECELSQAALSVCKTVGNRRSGCGRRVLYRRRNDLKESLQADAGPGPSPNRSGVFSS